MIKRVRITSKNDVNYEKALALYEASFPREERRDSDYLEETILRNDQFYAQVILRECDDEFVGIFFWWKIGNWRYGEHFAVNEMMRNHGMGRIVMESWINEDDTPIIFEVEHPEEEIQRRRILFYERLGIKMTPHAYLQPPYHRGEDFVDLKIMSYPNAVSEEELNDFIKKCHPIIHFKYPFNEV